MGINTFKVQNLKYSVLVTLFFALIFSSCSFQKRVYNKGFYVQKSQSINRNKSVKDSSLLAKITSPKHTRTQILTASTKNNTLDFFVSDKYLNNGCDTIYLKSGSRIYAHITGVNLTKVLFKNCGDDDDKILFVKKEDVERIGYATGVIENYSGTTTTEPSDKNQPKNLPGQSQNTVPDYYGNPNQNSYQQHEHSHNYNQSSNIKRKTNPFAVIGFIMSAAYAFIFLCIIAFVEFINFAAGFGGNPFSGIFSGSHIAILPYMALPLLTLLAAIAFCIIAIIQINKKGAENQKGLKIAWIGLALGVALLIVLLAIIF